VSIFVNGSLFGFFNSPQLSQIYQTKYLPFFVNQKTSQALIEEVQLGKFGTFAPHDKKNNRNHRYQGPQGAEHVDLQPSLRGLG
jgi:hypothetical protein